VLCISPFSTPLLFGPSNPHPFYLLLFQQPVRILLCVCVGVCSGVFLVFIFGIIIAYFVSLSSFFTSFPTFVFPFFFLALYVNAKFMLHALLVLPPLYLAFWDFWYAKIFSRAPWIKMGAAPPLLHLQVFFVGLPTYWYWPKNIIKNPEVGRKTCLSWKQQSKRNR